MKALKLWNGRGYVAEWVGGNLEPFKTWGKEGRYSPHIFVCAYSGADIARLFVEWCGEKPRGLENEIRVYWSKGCWGNQMDGIAQERGLWVAKDYNTKPVRLI